MDSDRCDDDNHTYQNRLVQPGDDKGSKSTKPDVDKARIKIVWFNQTMVTKRSLVNQTPKTDPKRLPDDSACWLTFHDDGFVPGVKSRSFKEKHPLASTFVTDDRFTTTRADGQYNAQYSGRR